MQRRPRNGFRALFWNRVFAVRGHVGPWPVQRRRKVGPHPFHTFLQNGGPPVERVNGQGAGVSPVAVSVPRDVRGARLERARFPGSRRRTGWSPPRSFGLSFPDWPARRGSNRRAIARKDFGSPQRGRHGERRSVETRRFLTGGRAGAVAEGNYTRQRARS